MKMFPKGDVSHIFNKFAGREVEMLEETKTLKFKNLGDITMTEVTLKNPSDATLKEMSDEATKNGLSLRVWWPGIMGTMDYDTSRVNAHIEKEADGKYRIAPRFDLG
ncbi:MAG: hypothetical protein PW788_02810 [Micavibrio sp.]|nr:hypothetical protein [Micavibrio sp.]